MLISLDDRYLEWLYARIGSPNETRPTRTYRCLIRAMHEKEFIWLIPNDDNRVEDGRDLRYEFLEESEISQTRAGRSWMRKSCSVLELVLGVAERLAFEADRTQHYWFWEMLHNLELAHCVDRGFKAEYVDEILDTFIWRTYFPNGFGGLFPLRHPREDQRDVEIWAQLQAYILERD